jgi:GT2 family glycosyltransferase
MSSVAAVVVTFNRQELLCRCLDALMAQTLPVDEIIVVDNASSDGTPDVLRLDYPELTHLRMSENFGPAGGFAEGIRYAYENGHDWVWVFNDDDTPQAEALQVLLEVARQVDIRRSGMIGSWRTIPGHVARDSMMWRRGRFRPCSSTDSTRPYRVDLITFSGVLISSKLITDIGVPRASYFMMFEETEYCLRAQTAGFEIYVVPKSLTDSLNAGSAGGASPPWRGYYQTRNHLLMVLEHRSPIELTWWAVRQAKFMLATMLWLDRKWERGRLRLLGAWHGLCGVDGRVIDPAGLFDDADTQHLRP